MYFDCLHLKVVGNKGRCVFLLQNVFNSISPKLPTLFVCIHGLFEGCLKQRQVLKDWPFYVEAWKVKSLNI